MNLYIRLFLALTCFLITATPMSSHATTNPHVKAQLISEREPIVGGEPFTLAIQLNIEEDWHVYWKNPGDAGMPLKIEWILPEGFEASPLQWPFPEKFSLAEMVGFGYKEEVILLATITPPKNLPSDSPISISAHVKWLVCSPLNCQPGSAVATLVLPTDSTQVEVKHPETDTFFKKAREKIPSSHVIVKTIHKEGVVHLEVPHQTLYDSSDSIVGVYFFPEDNNLIDQSKEATIDINGTSSSRYLISLKGGDEIGATKNQKLKGVLVLHTDSKSGHDVTAIDIDSPIHEESSKQLLSMAESPEKSVSPKPSIPSQQFSFEGGLSLALLFAFIGGIILNFMPCVLPVISLKVMSLVKMAGEERSKILKHSLMFCLGVLCSFWALASGMLILRTYGHAVGWGFQLQDPMFVIILSSLLFIFSLSFFGVFELGTSLSSIAGQAEADQVQKKSGYPQSFFVGVLATAVATPCTGPFLGSAVGYAVTLPAFQALLIFTALGLGMSAPYFLIALYPSLLRFLPKPGAWMELFKEIMGFVLLATVLWLLWVFSAQTNSLSLICALAGFLCFAMGAWSYGKGSNPFVKGRKRVFAYAFALLFGVAGIQAILLPQGTWNEESVIADNHDVQGASGWEPFSPTRLQELRAQGTPVFIDFTAKWCLICQSNHLVLSSSEVSKQFTKHGVVKMKADWTKNDPYITEALSQFGRNSVPLYILYGKEHDQAPLILPQVLTSDSVLRYIDETFPQEEVALQE